MIAIHPSLGRRGVDLTLQNLANDFLSILVVVSDHRAHHSRGVFGIEPHAAPVKWRRVEMQADRIARPRAAHLVKAHVVWSRRERERERQDQLLTG